jgi:chromosome segregation ATPase
MADNKGKSAANPGKLKPALKTSTLCQKLQNLICVAKEVDAEANNLVRYEEVLEEGKELRIQLEEKSKEMEKLQKTLDFKVKESAGSLKTAKAEKAALVSAFESRYKEYENGTARTESLEAQLSEAQDQVATLTRELREKEKSLSSRQREADSSRKEAERLQHALAQTNREFQVSQSNLQAKEAQASLWKCNWEELRAEIGEDMLLDLDDERLRKL